MAALHALYVLALIKPCSQLLTVMYGSSAFCMQAGQIRPVWSNWLTVTPCMTGTACQLFLVPASLRAVEVCHRFGNIVCLYVSAQTIGPMAMIGPTTGTPFK